MCLVAIMSWCLLGPLHGEGLPVRVCCGQGQVTSYILLIVIRVHCCPDQNPSLTSAAHNLQKDSDRAGRWLSGSECLLCQPEDLVRVPEPVAESTNQFPEVIL